VKKAVDLCSNKEVAIKILRISKESVMPKKVMLEAFFKEIKILSNCKHQNVVKLIDASFKGTIIKEGFSVRKSSVDHSKIDTEFLQAQKLEEIIHSTNPAVEDSFIIKRKANICYCVLKLARNGELFKILEYTDKFSD
jgi:serine/threonine protein kinase